MSKKPSNVKVIYCCCDCARELVVLAVGVKTSGYSIQQLLWQSVHTSFILGGGGWGVCVLIPFPFFLFFSVHQKVSRPYAVHRGKYNIIN